MPHPRRVRALISRTRAYADCLAATAGLGFGALLGAQLLIGNQPNGLTWMLVVLVVGLVGHGSTQVSRALTGARWPALLGSGVLAAGGTWASAKVLLVSVDPLLATALLLGVAGSLLPVPVPMRRTWLAFGGSLLLVTTSTAPAGAWSVDEPNDQDPRMVAGNGIVVAVDTHALLLQQGVAILRNDGHTAVADFLLSADPSAPRRRDPASGTKLAQHETFLWRMQRGSRDADRVNKPDMPDHFFNWWTHSGKGLIAGPSAATYAEEQHDLAVLAWQHGDLSRAAYHLGAAAHLVADACTPPHASPFVPEHRSYEEWVVPNQEQMKATSGGIYQGQFRVTSGHGGPEWSSSHTRGWLDECAHRAAGQIPNTMQPPSEDPLLDETAAQETEAHFQDTQRLTAGYLQFFFDQVGGP